MSRNYLHEADCAERLVRGGCRESEVETYLIADRNGTRPLDPDQITKAWIEAENKSDATAHRWHGGVSTDEEMIREAFGEKPSLTAQGKLVARYGETFAASAAARFGAKLGSLKPGVDPNAPAKDEKTKRENNPWASSYKGGAVAAEAERIRLIRTLGTKAASEMASAAGTDLAGRPLRSRVA